MRLSLSIRLPTSLMDRPIDLDNETGAHAVEIDDESIYRVLPAELESRRSPRP